MNCRDNPEQVSATRWDLPIGYSQGGAVRCEAHFQTHPRPSASFQSLVINEMGPPVLLPALFVVLRAERPFFPVTDGVDKIPLHSSRY